MIDIRFLRENPDVVRENIRKKFQDEKLPLVDEVIALDAERRAAQLVSQQEITARANMEAEELKQSTKEEIERLYHDVYQHIDEVLAQLDRTISEKLTDIRMTRQQIDQSIR